MKKTSSKAGFTLIELLLVTTILAIVGVVVYGTFIRGINIWQRVSQPTGIEDVGLFFRNLSYDLDSSFKMTGLPFRGSRSEISFPTRIKHRDENGLQDSIGSVTYSYDRRTSSIYKAQSDYSEIYRKKPGRKRAIAQGISSLRFEYFIYDPERKKYSWVTSWQERDEPFGEKVEENLPLIVKVEVRVSREDFEKKFEKTIYIPSACCWPLIDEKKND